MVIGRSISTSLSETRHCCSTRFSSTSSLIFRRTARRVARGSEANALRVCCGGIRLDEASNWDSSGAWTHLTKDVYKVKIFFDVIKIPPSSVE
jgi:hypothetical protein